MRIRRGEGRKRGDERGDQRWKRKDRQKKILGGDVNRGMKAGE